jgi:hypothetical protein
MSTPWSRTLVMKRGVALFLQADRIVQSNPLTSFAWIASEINAGGGVQQMFTETSTTAHCPRRRPAENPTLA